MFVVCVSFMYACVLNILCVFLRSHYVLYICACMLCVGGCVRWAVILDYRPEWDHLSLAYNLSPVGGGGGRGIRRAKNGPA